MKHIRYIASLILLCPVVGFGQSFDRPAFLEAFKNRVWNDATLVGTQARPDLRLGRTGAAWTQEFANVPQLSTVLHGRKADFIFALAAVAAEETGVPLIPPRAGWSHREGDPFVRPLVVMAGSDATSATPLSDFAFNAFALQLLKAAFEKSAACTITQTSWTPEPRTAAEWGKSLCLQMNQIVAAARIEFARTTTPQSERPAAVVSSPHAITLDRFRLPQDTTTASSPSGDPSSQPDPGAPKESLFATRKKIQQERAIKQQEQREIERQEQQKRAVEAQQARDLIVTKFLATDYAKRLTSSCVANMEYRDAHSAETLLPSEKVKAHDTNITFCGCISRQLAVDPSKIDADQRAALEMIISANKTNSKIPNIGVRDRFAQAGVACVTPDMVLSGAVSIRE